MQKLKELIKLSNLCNFQLYTRNIEGNISHQKLRNCCVAKKLTSYTFSVKFRVVRGGFLRNHSMYWAQSFRDNWNCYALSIFRVFISLVSSGWWSECVNEAKSVNKDSPIESSVENFYVWILGRGLKGYENNLTCPGLKQCIRCHNSNASLHAQSQLKNHAPQHFWQLCDGK